VVQDRDPPLNELRTGDLFVTRDVQGDIRVVGIALIQDELRNASGSAMFIGENAAGLLPQSLDLGEGQSVVVGRLPGVEFHIETIVGETEIDVNDIVSALDQLEESQRASIVSRFVNGLKTRSLVCFCHQLPLTSCPDY